MGKIISILLAFILTLMSGSSVPSLPSGSPGSPDPYGDVRTVPPQPFSVITPMVEEYLSETYNMSGKITHSEFHQYSYGIAGGLFQYDFIFKDNNGKKWKVYYHSYADISKDTMTEYTLSVEEKELLIVD